MYKLLVLLVPLLIMPMAAPVYATPPPAHGGYSGGWGMNPTDWDSLTGGYNSGLALYDPLGAGGGAGWVVTWNPENYIDYADITIQLWIEMYMIQTYYYTSYQYHRLGDQAEHLCFTISGTVASNEGVYVLCTAGALDPNFLHFMGNIGVGDDRNARDIPIVWEGRYGSGFSIGNNVILPWTSLTWSGGDLVLAEFEHCDHWFQFRGCLDIFYHEADGYYYLDLEGCPVPQM